MAQAVSFRACLIAIALSLAGSVATAETLSDPTRPSGVTRGPASPGAPAGQAAGGPRVSLILTHDDRSLAVVDGETVRVGSVTPHGRVARIDAESVCFAVADGKTQCARAWPRHAVQLKPAADATAPVRGKAEKP